MADNKDIMAKFGEYLDLNRQLTELRKQTKEIKDKTTEMEKEIMTYMVDNGLDNISLKDGEIVLYQKKISQTFKKETIVEKLKERLRDETKAQELTDSILSNKTFTLEDKVKAVIKKK
jgi:uroporphyrinogen-III decarboxylase